MHTGGLGLETKLSRRKGVSSRHFQKSSTTPVGEDLGVRWTPSRPVDLEEEEEGCRYSEDNTQVPVSQAQKNQGEDFGEIHEDL